MPRPPFNILICLLGSLAGAWAGGPAELSVLPEDAPQRVFGGGSRSIAVRVHATGHWTNLPALSGRAFPLRLQLLQLSSATAAPVIDRPWKVLNLLPGQTVLEDAVIELPSVRAETRFLVRWVEDGQRLLGATELLVYPEDMLKELTSLASPAPVGVLDPRRRLGSALKQAGVEFVELGNGSSNMFAGRLAVIDAAGTTSEDKQRFLALVKVLVVRRTGVVWLDDFVSARDRELASFQLIIEGDSRLVVAPSELLADLAGNPVSQLNLLRFAELVVKSESPWPPRFPQIIHPL